MDFSLSITGGNVSIVEFASGLFNENRDLTAITLPETLKKIGGTSSGNAVFRNCKNLTTVTPFLPDSLQEMGYCAFDGCDNLTGDLVLNRNGEPFTLSGNTSLGHQFNGTKVTSADLGEGVTSIGRAMFYACKQLTNVVLRGVSSVAPNAFNGCTKLENVWFYTKPTWDTGSASFGNHPTSTRFHIPQGSEAWAAFRTNPQRMTPWDSLSASDQAAYTTVYPDEPLPIGRTVSASGMAVGWILQWNPTGGYVTPSYSVDVVLPTDGSVSVVVTPEADAQGKYLEGTAITVTASSTTREFVRWFGSVPMGMVSNETFSTSVLGPLSCVPYYAPTALHYDAAAKTLSDGYWTYEVADVGGNQLKVVRVLSSTPACAIADLSAPVDDGVSTVVELGAKLFYDNKTLEEVKLPNTLQKIAGEGNGQGVFQHCSNLRVVTPFLPETLEVLGCCVFDSCGSLTGDLVLNPNGGDFTLLTNGYYYHMFNQSKITSVDLGAGVTNLGRAVFFDCSQLTNVVLRGVESIGINTFGRCLSLRDVWFYTKPTLSSDKSSFGTHPNTTRFHVPKFNEEWIAFMEDASMMTPWAELSEATQKIYTNAYPGEPLPVGRTLSASLMGEGWILTWVPPGQEQGTVLFFR